MVTGSIVSGLQGEPRATHDVDIVINIQPSSIPNLIDTTEGDKVDFRLLTNDVFDKSKTIYRHLKSLRSTIS